MNKEDSKSKKTLAFNYLKVTKKLLLKYLLNFMEFIWRYRRKYVEAIFVFVLFFTFVSIEEVFSNSQLEWELNEVVYVYDEAEYIAAISGDDQVEEIEEYFESFDLEEGEVLKTEVENSYTLLAYEESTQEEIEVIQDEVEVMVDGYTLIIDDYLFYIEDENLYYDLENFLYQMVLPENIYEIYLDTGTINNYVVDGKEYTDITIENDISITPSYVPGAEIITSYEELTFKLLNPGQEPEYATIDENTTLSDIQNEYNLTTEQLILNNPSLANQELMYNNQQIIVNEPDPILNLSVTYEYTVEEIMPYNKTTTTDDTLAKDEEVITQYGSEGSQNVTYKTKIVNGEEVDTTAVDYEIIVRPTDQITTIGTKEESYTGTTSNSTGNGQSTGNFIWPSPSRNVICGYGCYPGHVGIDIQAWYGAPIYAADSGVVTFSGQDPYGAWRVDIDHGNGYKTVYAHQTHNTVSTGDYVSQGQTIGYEGQTGLASTHHLHYEVWYNGSPIDPMSIY